MGSIKKEGKPLPVWLRCLERRLVNPKFGGLILGQGTYLGYGFNPCSGYVWEATNPCFSLMLMFLSPSVPSPLSKINTCT